MNSYEDIVRSIVNCIVEQDPWGDYPNKVRPQDIAGIINSRVGQVNCYPGIPSASCCKEAFFVSLRSKEYATGRGHISCRTALEKLVQHMQGHCINVTDVAILITDSWDVKAYDEWRSNIKQIKKNAQVEVYIVNGKNITRMHI